MTRHQARYPNSDWEPKTRRMVGPMYNPTPWISPTSPVYPPTPAPGPWEVDPGVIYERQRLAQRLNQSRTSLEAELQRRQNTDESPQWEYVPGEGYRQVEPGRRSGANNQHYSRRANEQRREDERRFLRDVQSEVARDNGYPQIDRREPPNTRRGPDTNSRAPVPDIWTDAREAREWMGEVQREVNLRGSYIRFPSGYTSRRGSWSR
ncbi:uncharacterized protein BKA55DRAFT_546603 [Fusarium redolens]|uniref:Uncharacterized protein n=1 Tax=Fusarium redolens TaxID=48865 RepID=A0A9P9JKY6_FUSRE|nr:uncharacterized protein BKA55DRAFT_546603 [Fusarium redolens]KAH7213383.1 hypothetical protein BKA55DRAFT_546603 [Fusarium redolens]